MSPLGLIRPEHLRRKAMVFIRQSDLPRLTQSGPRQLVNEIQQLGFHQVEMLNPNPSAIGSAQLLADVAAGRLGAVVSTHGAYGEAPDIETHDMLNAAAISGAVVINPVGIFNPRSMHDRQRLGLNGQLSRWELQRLCGQILNQIRTPAASGVRPPLPAGLYWNRNHDVDLDPDYQVRQAIQSIFQRFARSHDPADVLRWLQHNRFALPAPVYVDGQARMEWKHPDLQTVRQILTDPMYAGAFALGPRMLTAEGHIRNPDLLIRDHHNGYVPWQTFERNQRILNEDRRYRVIDLQATPEAAGPQHYAPVDMRHQSDLLDALHEAQRWADEVARRYASVDPNNHYVKSELERQWNETLSRVRALSGHVTPQASGPRAGMDPRHASGPAQGMNYPLTQAPHAPFLDRQLTPAMAPPRPPAWSHMPQPQLQLFVGVYPRDIAPATLPPGAMPQIFTDPNGQQHEVVVVPDWVDPQAVARSLPRPVASGGRYSGDDSAGVHLDALLQEQQGRVGPDHMAVDLNRAGVRVGSRASWTSERVQKVRRYARERD